MTRSGDQISEFEATWSNDHAAGLAPTTAITTLREEGNDDMATVRVRGAGHPDDPFQVLVVLGEDDVNCARTRIPRPGPTSHEYDADHQTRAVVAQISYRT